MSAPTQPHQRQIEDWILYAREVLKAMNQEQMKFYQAFFATAVCGLLAWNAMRSGYPVTSAICAAGIPIVNGLTFREVMRGIDIAREQDRRQGQEDSE